ncbi:MAG: 50S ribosomal protein P1 [Candidatus Aenigmarchaeota archaeon]|nr:50S ribosomal protein P1 [Candidatus Aenigmarchaeota archaeon]OYT58083.1 MAG: 50S ribosomal protein P1 [Candidatus Aenigmarchaeota archaeon ex4484_14]RLI96706.1 MAG: 50S ribosomal protein P1 [Candidatus Aenigmarchaeota archaeon]
MQLIYAALLLHSAGKEINEENLKKIVDAVGVGENDAQIKALVAALEGVNIDEAISKAAMPVAAAAPAATPAEGAKEEKKKKEEDTEKKAEEAAAGLGALFG